MERFDTLFRQKNIDFFLSLSEQKTSKAAARISKLSPQHGRKLIRAWVRAGWVEKRPTLHGSKYFLAKDGESISHALAVLRTHVGK